MKPLYYLEFARSYENDGTIIPAKKLNWFTIDSFRIGYEDIDTCAHERLSLQKDLTKWIVRIETAGPIMNLFIRICSRFGWRHWKIVKK